jgi:hypothetical protein
LNPYLLGDAEIINGPGAMAPQVNYAINGTVNFRTKDPTPNADSFYTVGASSRNGGVYALGVSDTILNNRLGFVFGVAGLSDPSALHYAPAYFDPGSGSIFLKGVNLYPYGCNTLNPLLGTDKTLFYSRAYNTCGFVATTTVSGDYNNEAQLFKVRYRIAGRTFFTASYFGSQSSANQSGNVSFVPPSIFTPGSAYHGALAPQSGIDDRVQKTGFPNPLTPFLQSTNIYGTEAGYSGSLVFSGTTQNVDVYNYFNEPEIDKITGYSFEYGHPFGSNSELAFAADTTHSTSVNYYQNVGFAGRDRRALCQHVYQHVSYQLRQHDCVRQQYGLSDDLPAERNPLQMDGGDAALVRLERAGQLRIGNDGPLRRPDRFGVAASARRRGALLQRLVDRTAVPRPVESSQPDRAAGTLRSRLLRDAGLELRYAATRDGLRLRSWRRLRIQRQRHVCQHGLLLDGLVQSVFLPKRI